VRLAGQPGEHRLGGGNAARLPYRDPELDQRHEPPVSAAPLAVDVDPEAAVGLLPCEQRADPWPFENLRRLGRIPLAEQVALRLEDDTRLLRREQPFERPQNDAVLTQFHDGLVTPAATTLTT